MIVFACFFKQLKQKHSIFQAVMAIKAPRRWVITATPMQNKFKEVQSLAHNIIGVPKMPMSEMLDEYYLRCV